MIDYMLDLWAKLHVSYRLRLEVLKDLARLIIANQNSLSLNFEEDTENQSSLSN